MNIVLTSDNIKSKAIDQKFMEDIAAKLNQAGHKATVYLPVDPNSHIQGMYKAPLDSLIVNIYGGACAGTIYEMGEAWFIKARSTRKVMILWRTQAKDIRGLDWLVRAWDDDFSPESFKGLAHPDEYLTKYGYSFDYQDTVDGAVASILKVATPIVKEEIKLVDISKSGGAVPLAVFQDMMKRVDAYVLAKKATPAIVYVVTGKGDYVPFTTFTDMKNRYNAYKRTTGNYPALIYYTKPVPKRTVGALQGQLEAFLGQFNNFTEFYNKCKGRGYSYYYNDVKTLSQEIAALKAKTGMNCSDASQLFTALAKEMGYETRYVHVMCKNGGHIRMQIKGKEFSDWTRVDPAACLSVGSQYPIGQVWCDYDNAHVETENWILVDDGA